jgi:hypothetical protein
MSHQRPGSVRAESAQTAGTTRDQAGSWSAWLYRNRAGPGSDYGIKPATPAARAA